MEGVGIQGDSLRMSYYEDEDTYSVGSVRDDENVWSMALHLSFLLGFPLPFLGYIMAPLCVLLLGREGRPVLNDHFREVANFFITWCVIPAVALGLYYVFVFLTLGIGIILMPLVILIGICWTLFVIICPVAAAIKAYNNESFRYPLTIRVV